MKLQGNVEVVEHGEWFVFVCGWLLTESGDDVRQPVNISVDGEKPQTIGQLTVRPDLRMIARGKCIGGFATAVMTERVTWPPRITLSAPGYDEFIPNLQSITAQTFKARGVVEAVDLDGLSGWIFDPGTLAKRIPPQLTYGSSQLDIVRRSYRPDVPFSVAGQPSSEHGFSMNLGEIVRKVRPADLMKTNPPINIEACGSYIRWGVADDEEADLKSRLVDALQLHSKRLSNRIGPYTPAVAVRPGSKQRPTSKRELSQTTAARKKLLVVSWDMSHNPAGRAYLLAELGLESYDVELFGPIFSKYGAAVWEPIANTTKVPISAFDASANLQEFIILAREASRNVTADYVYVSKPRLPSMLLGMMIAQRCKCPLLLDIDDHELSFFKTQEPLNWQEAIACSIQDPTVEPFGEIWTRACESIVMLADGVTVSNPALQRKFGGIVVRHARDESLFRRPSEQAREAIRREFGIKATDKAVVFVGTPRAHKGVFRIAEALERIADERLVFVIIGTITDKRTRDGFKAFSKARIIFHDNQPWDRLPSLVSMGDAIAVLQSADSDIAAYQIPAKISDAIALGVPVLCTPVPPLFDLINAGVLISVNNDLELDDQLRLLARGQLRQSENQSRDFFLSEFSYAVNATRMNVALSSAKSLFSSRTAQGRDDLLKALNRFSRNQTANVAHQGSSLRGRQGHPKIINLVMFWKQNDSDLYGRRQDMLAKYLLKSGRVGKIVHFDRALSFSEFEMPADQDPLSHLHQGNFVYVNTVKRLLRMSDTPKLKRRVFLHRDGTSAQRFLSRDLPPRSEYPQFVKGVLEEEKMLDECVAWVSPVVFDFPEIDRLIKFKHVVSDLIDDQRRFPGRPEYLQRIGESYKAVLARSDIVLTNCEAMREAFSPMRRGISVIPNGSEVFEGHWSRPEDLEGIPRPIIGYVGNLRDRIDVALIDKISAAHPTYSFVLIGSAHGAVDILKLSKRPNIFFLGVRPYEEAVNYISQFDVAIMPHLDNSLSQSMNPLKLYVYTSVGVPVVTTRVANISDLEGHVVIAGNHAEFIRGVEQMLEKSPDRHLSKASIPADITWPRRVDEILKLIDIMRAA